MTTRAYCWKLATYGEDVVIIANGRAMFDLLKAEPRHPPEQSAALAFAAAELAALVTVGEEYTPSQAAVRPLLSKRTDADAAAKKAYDANPPPTLL